MMEALGLNVEAQAFRWQCFERTLSIAHLRNYLKRLPDFEDLEAEESAMSHALKSSNVHQALAFLVFWPALDKAATLVTKRASELTVIISVTSGRHACCQISARCDRYCFMR